jgi:YD repeat-containing protein
MTYGTRGQLLTVRDPAGHVTTSTYDKYGNLLSVRRPGDPAAMQLTWDETGLLCTRIADPLGHTKDFVYDANDRLNRITWSSLAGTPSIVLEWDAFHQRRLSDELGNATLFENNLFGLRTSTTSPSARFDGMPTMRTTVSWFPTTPFPGARPANTTTAAA